MHREEIEHLKETLKFGPYGNKADPIWRKAFNKYNSQKDIFKPLGMGCFPCYKKVLNYSIQTASQND